MSKLLRFLQVQLALTCFSLTIITSWGLALSWSTVLGNLFFVPFLWIFLSVSSCIFFLDIFSVPHGVLNYCLEWVTQIWLFFMNKGFAGSLFYVPAPSLWVQYTIPGLTCTLLIGMRKKKLVYQVLLLAGLLLVSLVYLMFFEKRATTCLIPCARGEIYVEQIDNQTVLVDTGYLRWPQSPTWFQFSLIATMATILGTAQIDHCVITAVNKRTIDALETMAALLSVKNIYIPKSVQKITWFTQKLEQLTKDYHCSVTYIDVPNKKPSQKITPHTLLAQLSLQ